MNEYVFIVLTSNLIQSNGMICYNKETAKAVLFRKLQTFDYAFGSTHVKIAV